jgi:hypothetical protein
MTKSSPPSSRHSDTVAYTDHRALRRKYRRKLKSTRKSLQDLKTESALSLNCLNALKAGLNCAVCVDVFSMPFTLVACGHTFCYECLDAWLAVRRAADESSEDDADPMGKKSCPICRQRIADRPLRNAPLESQVQLCLPSYNEEDRQNFIRRLNVSTAKYERDTLQGKCPIWPFFDKHHRALVDGEDGVRRCTTCMWEVVGDRCVNCGERMVDSPLRDEGDHVFTDDESVSDEDYLSTDRSFSDNDDAKHDSDDDDAIISANNELQSEVSETETTDNEEVEDLDGNDSEGESVMDKLRKSPKRSRFIVSEAETTDDDSDRAFGFGHEVVDESQSECEYVAPTKSPKRSKFVVSEAETTDADDESE